MNATQTCPSHETLQNYLLGRIHDADRDTLDEHFLHCEHCLLTAETLAVEDDLTRAALGANAPELSDQDAVNRLIERITQAHQQTVSGSGSISETLPSHPAASAAASGDPTSNADGTQAKLDFLAPAQEPDELGRLGDYRILEVIGVGGMGLVLRAEDTKLHRQVALKTMKPSIAESPSAKSRFMREAQATAALEHDHIVPIYQVGEDRGVPFIAMPYLRGQSLKKRLAQQRRLPIAEVVRIGQEVASGLAVAHQHGMIHRDIKPDNIWLHSKSDRAKILDFGLVSAPDDNEGLTHSGTILGTPRYMAPEQTLAQPLDHRCDLFSLGSVLYEAIVGESPFRGDNFTATLMAVARDDPRPLSQAAPDCPPELAALVTRLLQKDPADRPQSADEVVKQFTDLEQRLKGIQIKQTDDDKLTDTVSIETVPPLGPQTSGLKTQAGNHKPPRRRWSLVAGAGGFAAVLLGVIIITIKQPDGTVTKLEVPEGSTVEIENKPTGIVAKEVKPNEPAMKEVETTLAARRTITPIGANKVALQFNGIDNYVDITSDWTWNGEDLTFEAWVEKGVPDGSADMTIMSLGHGTDQRRGLLLRTLSRELNGKSERIIDAAMFMHPSYIPFTRDTSPTHQLSHLAVVWQKNKAAFYIDGKRQPSGEYEINHSLTRLGESKHTYLGACFQPWTGESDWFWNGLIHQARFTAGVLYKADFTPEQNLTADSQTIGLYKFDEAEGDIVRDSSGNNRHGTIHGARWISLEESPTDGPLLANAKPILVEPAAPLSPRATVSRPAPIDGLRSWSIEAVGLNDYEVNDVAWHPSGEWYVTYGRSGTLRVCSADGQLRQVVLANETGVYRGRSAMFLDDGNLLVTLSMRGDNTFRIWDTATWKCVREFPHPPGFNARAMAWSPVLRRLAIAGHPGVFVINPATGQTWQRGFEEHCLGADFAPDGSVLVVSGESGRLYWLDPLSLETLLAVELRREPDGAKTYGNRVAFSPDSRLVACTAPDGVVRIFDAKTSELQTVVKPAANRTYDLQWFSDSQRLAVTSDSGPLVSVWDITQPDEPLLKTGGGISIALAISPDESEIYYSHAQRQSQLYALNLESGLSRRVHGNDGQMAGGVPSGLSRQGDRVGDVHQGVFTIWDSATGRPLTRYENLPSADRLDWSPDGQTIAVYHKRALPNNLSLLDVDTGKVTEPLLQKRKVWGTAWSPDGTRLAISGGDDPIEIVNPQSGEITLRLSEESKQSFGGYSWLPQSSRLAWSPDGESLAAWNKDGVVRVWDTATGSVKAEEAEFEDSPFIKRLAWFPDSRRLCLLLDTHLTIWDSQSGEQSPLEHFSRGNVADSASVASDGSSIMVASNAGANFWRGEKRDDRKFIGYFGRIAAWHPDNRRVLISGTTAYDTHTFQRLGKLLRHFPDGGWAVIGPDGHYRGGVLGGTDQQPGDGTTPEELAAIEKHLVYITQHEDGSRHTYTPSEFRDTFDWKNDPNKATLLALPEQ